MKQQMRMNFRHGAKPAGLRKAFYDHCDGAVWHVASVYDGTKAHMDVGDGRWQAVCERHATISAHWKLNAALYSAEHTDEWCEECRAELEEA